MTKRTHKIVWSLRVLAALLVLVSPLVAQPTVREGQGIFSPSTVGNLPSTAADGLIQVVTDGADASDCATGGGASRNICVYDAGTSSWVIKSGGGGGTINSGTDNQVACYDGAGTTLADCDCTFTMDGTNVVWQCGTDSVTGLQYLDADGAPPILNIDTTNERVGIGTAAPSELFHINADDFGAVQIEFSNNTARWLIGMNSSEQFLIRDNTDFITPFLIDDVTHSVSIGPKNTSPTGTLLVYDATATTGVTTQTVKAGAGQSTNDLQLWTDNSDVVLAKVTSETLSLADGGTRPTCDAAHRGNFWYDAGGAGVKDTVDVCAKDAGDAYAWRVIY